MTEIAIAHVEAAFKPLLGLPMWSAGWAGEIAWFQFGNRVKRLQRGGGDRMVGQHALHLSCPWRWVTPSGFVRADEASSVESLAGLEIDSPCLESVTILATGMLTLRFVGGDLLITSSDLDGQGEEIEYWRLLQPGLPIPHVVVSRAGAEWHEA